MIDTPKFRFPFNISNNRAEIVEQDSIDEIAQCVYAVLATEEGSRVEEPEFGIEDQAHKKNGADISSIREAISTWEPRVQEFESEEDWDDVMQKVRLIIDG